MPCESILSLFYLGNIRYFTKLIFTDTVIDIHENYQRRSYRNRCDVLTANGPVSLVIPTVKGDNFLKNSVKNTRIDHSSRWQHRHWTTLVSAYANSPFFDHYSEKFSPFYHRRYDFLWDFNRDMLETAVKILAPDITLTYSDNYVDLTTGTRDYRDSISPKKSMDSPDPRFRAEPYYQVFRERYGFIPNLSIIDLIMCEGPSSREIIKESYVAEPDKSGI